MAPRSPRGLVANNYLIRSNLMKVLLIGCIVGFIVGKAFKRP